MYRPGPRGGAGSSHVPKDSLQAAQCRRLWCSRASIRPSTSCSSLRIEPPCQTPAGNAISPATAAASGSPNPARHSKHRRRADSTGTPAESSMSTNSASRARTLSWLCSTESSSRQATIPARSGCFRRLSRRAITEFPHILGQGIAEERHAAQEFFLCRQPLTRGDRLLPPFEQASFARGLVHHLGLTRDRRTVRQSGRGGTTVTTSVPRSCRLTGATDRMS